MNRHVGLVLILLAAAALNAQPSVEAVNAEAEKAYLAGDYARAAALSRQVYALRMAANPRDDFAVATAAFKAGRSLIRAGQHATAIPYLEIACENAVTRWGSEHAAVGSCLMELADGLAGAGKVTNAKEVTARALDVIRATYPPDGYAAAVFHAGETFRDAREAETAIAYFQEAALLYVPGKLDQPEYLVASLAEIGELLYDIGRYRDAALILERALSLDPFDVEKPGATVISRIYMLADCYREIGEYDEALVLLDRVAASLSAVTLQGHVRAEAILLQIAQLQYENGGSSEALATVARVLAQLPDRQDVDDQRIAALHLAGRIHTQLHNYEEAERQFDVALTNAQRNPERSELVPQALSELGFFLLRRGRYAESRARMEEALRLVEKVEGPRAIEAARLLQLLAIGIVNQGDCDSARPLIERSRAIYSKEKAESTEMMQSLSLAAVCAPNNARRLALRSEALRLRKKIEGETSTSWLIASAEYAQERGRWNEASAAVEAALAREPGNARAHELRAQILDARSNSAEGARVLRDVIAAAASSYGDDSINAAARRFNLGRMLLRAGDAKGAREAFLAAATAFDRHTRELFALVSLAEQRQSLEQHAAVEVSGILSVCHADPCLADGYGVMVSWKGLVFEGLRRQSELTRSMEARANDPAVARLRTLRTQLALWASTREARAFDEWKKKHDKLTAEKEALERAVLAASGSTASPAAVTLGDLQAALQEAEVLIDVYRYEQFGSAKTIPAMYAAVITGRAVPPKFVQLGTAAKVEQVVAGWMTAVQAGAADAEWSALRRTVWAPLAAALAPGIRVARVSADGDLLTLPWHAFTGGGVKIKEVDSARALVRARSASRTGTTADRVVIVGGVDYDAGRTPRTPGHPQMPFATLRWSKDESKEIERLAGAMGMATTWLSDAEATKKKVLEQISAGTYVHFATHGFVPDTTPASADASRAPLVESGLALSGANVRDPKSYHTTGILTAEEILGSSMTRAKLVVLSACNTGLGVKAPGQGVLGLRSSLHAAGARRLVMSLWPVDDEATQLLMKSFYRKLWIERKPLLNAFHQAQADVRGDARFKEPKYWAGWSIVDPD
jgi:tetratricopeptide (TPR) repeat protein